MTRRRLSPEELKLWHQLTRSVRPIREQPHAVPDGMIAAAESGVPMAAAPARRVKGRVPPPLAPSTAPQPPRREPVPVLDRSWERRIRSGQLQPEHSVDLHGHTLPAAHAALEAALRLAVANGLRVLLVVTGKPRTGGDLGGRGAIRAEIGHWLERSALADRIASVRVAHPRHGGDGALYVILRRER